ncbi:MAG: Bax inhibitor-1/YccA family protein [Bacteroidales bacterium]|nr:Bax inhibitor-1/YccA family protein [Bacteroidales bacterium]
MNNYSSLDVNKSIAINTFISKVYGWMALALALTGITAFYVSSTPSISQAVFSNQFLFWGLIIGELILVFVISGAINRISSQTATLLFLLYSVINGITLSFIFIVYTKTSIATTFFITAGTFAIMSVYGFVTKKDLTKLGALLFMVLIGVVIAALVNIFLKSSTLQWIITIVGIIVFVGLIAYDTQKIKQIGDSAIDSQMKKKLSIIGALSLYLDFINLFLLLLQLFGGRRN